MTTGTEERFRGSALSYDVTELGWNYRMDNLRASLGLAQLRQLPVRLQRRRDLRRLYGKDLSRVTKVSVPFRDRIGEIGYHIMPILLDRDIDRKSVMQYMSCRGIQTSIHYPAVHTFAAYRDRFGARLPLTEDVAARLITLPFYPSMTDEMVDEVTSSLGEIIAEA
jgi:dTDP-4-amino-4,6-dideoxygalactose transaminase